MLLLLWIGGSIIDDTQDTLDLVDRVRAAVWRVGLCGL